MDIAKAGFSDPRLDVKNLYYGVTVEQPGLRYTYDLTAEVEGSLLRCTAHYMPYKTGEYPEGFAGAMCCAA